MKKILLWVVVGPLCLLLLLMAFLLVPAHWQIRQVEPALPTAADIERALPAEQAVRAISYINTATQSGPFGVLGHPAVLIEWHNGATFLIDTGMSAERAVAFGAPMERFLGAGPTRTYGSVLRQLGSAAQGIGVVAFTHLHSDHTDGIGELCAAQATTATVYQTSQQRHMQNFGTRPGEDNIVNAVCPREVLPDGMIKAVPGFPGLVAIAVGGHTPGSTVYAVRLRGVIRVFSGDITNDMASLREDTDKHWLYTTFIVPENPARQQQLRQWLHALDQRADFAVLAAHDIEAWQGSGLPRWQAAGAAAP